MCGRFESLDVVDHFDLGPTKAGFIGQKLNALVILIIHLLVQVCQVVQPLLSHTLDVIVLILSRWSDVL